MKNFEEYIDWRVHNDLQLQRDFFFSDNNCLMDFIGKLEKFNDHILHVSEALDIKIKAHHFNRSRMPGDDYRKYYTKASFQLVKEAFKPDIEEFNYQEKMKEDLNLIIAAQ